MYQTRKQEITEQEYDSLSDDEKRFYQRKLTKQGNYTLQKVASSAGVKNMAEFHNAGYKGLYNGETADENDRLFIKEDENSDVKWIELDSVKDVSSEKWLVENVYNKLNIKLKSIKQL